MDSKIIQIENKDQFESIRLTERIFVLVFTAEWCQPSLNLVTQLKKELDAQRKKLISQQQSMSSQTQQQFQTQQYQTNQINIYVVDHDKDLCAALIRQFAPSTLPYAYLFEKQKYIAQFGGMDIFAMNKLVKKALESSRAI